MDHDNDIGTCFEGFSIAGLLVAAIAVVGIMDKGLDSKLVGEERGVVAAGVVDENLDINAAGQTLHSLLQRSLSVVGRHDDRYAFSIDHRVTSCSVFRSA